MEFLSTHAKEKADMILEPMQVMIQLAVLSHEPLGTKIRVNKNILYLQRPTWSQGIQRWWNNDNKDDLYYLFHAIRRYYKWYKNQENRIYDYILNTAIKGIDKLIETYSKTDKLSIRQTLSLYKNILDLETPNLFKDETEQTTTIDEVFKGILLVYDTEFLRTIYNILLLMDKTNNNQEQLISYSDGITQISIPMNEKIQNWIHSNLTC